MRDRDDGFAVVEWMVGIAALLLPAAILTLSIAGWAQRTTMARTIAQEAARTMVLAPTAEAGLAAAEGLSLEIAANYGLDGGRLCGTPNQSCVAMAMSGEFVRGAEMTATVRVLMPAIVVPFVGEVGAFEWAASHTERVEDYRSFP